MKSYGYDLTKLMALLLLTLFCGAAVVAQTPTSVASAQPCEAKATGAGDSQSGLKLSYAQLDFGSHDIGTQTNGCAVTVTNPGTDPISALNFVDIGSNYSLDKKCGETLAGNASCAVYLRFTPTVAGDVSAKLQISFAKKDGTAGTAELQLKGAGYLPRIAASPQALDFGSQLISSTSATKTIMLKAGTAAVKVPAISASGDFTVTPAKCDNLDPSATCSLAVTFSPKHVQSAQGAITITTDGAPVVVSLSGEGTATCGPPTGFFTCEGWKSAAPVLVIVGIYLLALIFVRWNMIAVPTRRLLLAQIESVQARVALFDPTNPVVVQINQLLKNANQAISARDVWDWVFWARGLESAGWNRVHEAEEEMVALQDLETVRAALATVQSELSGLNKPNATAMASRIDAVLKEPATDWRISVLQEVVGFLAPQSATLATKIDAALASPALVPAGAQALAAEVVAFLQPSAAALGAKVQCALNVNPPTTVTALTPLLQQAATTLNPQATALAASLQAGTTAAPALTVAQWTPILTDTRNFLAQQSPFLARIKAALVDDSLPRFRALLSEALGLFYDSMDSSFDTLASWNNKTVWLVGCGLLLIVFLAVVLQHGVLFLVGATGGLLSRMSRSLYRADVPTDYGASWTTLFLSPVVGALAGWSGVLLIIVAVQLNVLGNLFNTVDWCNPYAPMALGLAFLLGFSERAFDEVLTQLENKVAAQGNATTPSGPKIITGASLPPATIGTQYDQTLSASGASLKWARTGGTLPAGLDLDPSGKISGKPAGPEGTATFTLQVSDAGGKTASQQFTIVVGK